jgi:hypothetical protein
MVALVEIKEDNEEVEEGIECKECLPISLMMHKVRKSNDSVDRQQRNFLMLLRQPDNLHHNHLLLQVEYNKFHMESFRVATIENKKQVLVSCFLYYILDIDD